MMAINGVVFDYDAVVVGAGAAGIAATQAHFMRRALR